ncbi:MAG: SDR family oxidoreductase [Pseudomonadota bacterium]
MHPYKALIAGVTGAVGGAVGRHLVDAGYGEVVGLSRRPAAHAIDGVRYVQADLDDLAATRRALEAHLDITHVFYCARASHAEQTLENAPGNLRLLEHLVSALEPGALEHVHVVQGGKVYGVHIGPFPTPAREDDARAPIENFNYAHEDFLRARAPRSGWRWSTSRPNTLLHFSPSIARNLISSLGAYAAICRELGAALDFPGPAAAYDSITQITSLEILTDAIDWMSRDPWCANEAFNITNGDVFRWHQVWPLIADFFDMPCGTVRPMRLATTMPVQARVWETVAARHNLASARLEDVANWEYLDATLERTWDEILSTNKARAFGFHGWADTLAEFATLLGRYRKMRILP